MRSVLAAMILFLTLPLLIATGTTSKPEQSPAPTQSPVETFLFENFEDLTIGQFPKNWKPRGWQQKANKVYSVQLDGTNKVLRALDHGEDVSIGKDVNWDWKKFPVLSWRWRAKVLPTNAAENNQKINDSAAGVYIILKGGIFVRDGLKYVWSSTLPISESNVSYKDSLRTIVLQTGPAKLGQWVTQEVNYVEHYRKHFGKENLPKILGIAVLTDANATNSTAEADYDDFVLKSR